MTPISPKPASGPSEIGGYSILHALSDQSWLAQAPGGRRVVLKTLDEDCLWKGQLHPSVRDRLARVRELAHPGVANLYGVERDAGLTYLVWEYVEGISLDEFAASPQCANRDLLLLARELVLNVEVLHARGIVHGMLKSSNVIITPARKAVLTHISPLLYSNPAQDVATLVGVLTGLLEDRSETDSPLGQILQQAATEETSLRRLALRLGAAIEARDAEPPDPTERKSTDRIKRRALIGAGATALIGIALFLGLKQFASAHTPKPPVAPQASPAALQPAPHGQSPTAAVATRAAP
jgi:serine/threonine protein kinase